jgi:hypothetical protein
VSPYQIQGLVSVMIALALVVFGLVALLLSAFRLLLVRGKPGRGRVARGVLAAAAVWISIGIVIASIAELTDHQRLMDRVGAPALAAAAVVAALWLVVRLGRRARTRTPVDADADPAASPPDPAP